MLTVFYAASFAMFSGHNCPIAVLQMYNFMHRNRVSRQGEKQGNLVERFFNKLKYYRWIAIRYDKLGLAFAAMIKFACIRIRLLHDGSTDHNASGVCVPTGHHEHESSLSKAA
jgi:hypothetical protein